MSQLTPWERPEQPVLKQKGFAVRGSWFGVEGVPRLEGGRLLELFFPERLRLKRDQKRAVGKGAGEATTQTRSKPGPGPEVQAPIEHPAIHVHRAGSPTTCRPL